MIYLTLYALTAMTVAIVANRSRFYEIEEAMLCGICCPITLPYITGSKFIEWCTRSKT